MDHAFFADRLSAYFDNELPPQEKQVVEEHLRDCAECRTELAKLKQLEDAVNRHADLADTAYWERSAQKIEQRLGFEQKTVVTPIPRTKFGSGMAWKAVAAAASISVLAYIGINSEKILKREMLEPQQIQAPSTIPTEQSPADWIDSVVEVERTHEISTPPQVSDQLAPATDDKKQPEPKIDYAVEPTKNVPPAIQKSRAIPPTEQLKANPDISTAERPAQESASDQTSLESQNITVTIPEERARVAPTSLMTPSSLPADSTSPHAEQFAGKLKTRSKEVAVARLDADVSDTILTMWRTKRDNLLAMQKALATTESKDAIFDIRQMAAPTALQKTEKSAPQLSRTEIEKQLVESWYNLARLTNDPGERTSSVAQIKQVADNPKSLNQALAAGYLKQLTSR